MAEYELTEENKKLNNELSENCRCSLETNSSISNENLLNTRNSCFSPHSHQFVFEFPSEETIDKYSKMSPALEQTLSYLEETMNRVNIRDDCSIQPNSVILRFPKRRNTTNNC